MKNHFYRIGLLLITLLPLAHSSHIVGGNFQLIQLAKGSPEYRLSLIMFFDEKNGTAGAKDNSITVGIFRKRDNVKMQTVTMQLTTQEQVVYSNEACAASNALKTLNFEYTTVISLPPSTYNDPDGYYVIWERCCRNSIINNIVTPQTTGQTFYMSFPPTTINDSTPVFNKLDGEFICINTDYSVLFDATDNDGDQLTYRLVTPYRGNSSQANPIPTPTGSSSYTPVSWALGYSETNAIPGNPTLTINPLTGLLKVKANQLGVYVFTVEVTQSRNGNVLGVTRRDFQILVIDCENVLPPKAPIYPSGSPPTVKISGVKNLDICADGFVVLETNNVADFNYQWQLNGDNIDGATSPKLQIDKAGLYKVVLSYAKKCGKTTASDSIVVVEKPGEIVKILTSGDTTFCADKKITLTSSKTGTNYTYLWTKNGDSLKTQIGTQLKDLNESATYGLLINNKSSTCSYNLKKVVTVNPLPLAKIVNLSNKKVVCENDTIKLRTDEALNYTYQWKNNNAPMTSEKKAQFIATQTGSYAVTTTNDYGCEVTTDTVNLLFNPLPKNVTFDSIPSFCGGKTTLIPLVVSPAGGVFAGNGLVGNQFDAALAGQGRHLLSYTVTNQYKCQTVVKRIASVSKLPYTQLPSELSIYRGGAITLRADSRKIPDEKWTFQWTPSTALSSSMSDAPLANPENETDYLVRITNSEGCWIEASVKVKVYQGVFIPEIFTPNGDGTNEVWELKGAEFYPAIEVNIYDRWGITVFSSKGYQTPFNGTLNGVLLPAGVYAYTVRTTPDAKLMQGSLVLVR